MKRPSFLEGAGVALIAAAAAGLGLALLCPLLPVVTVARVVADCLALAYLAYLLRRSPERVGRLVTLMVWFLAAGLLWLSAAPLSLHILTHSGLLWLARSLYFHGGPLAALADLGLTGLAMTIALGAYLHTGNTFLAVWCLFLVQALFVLIPVRDPEGTRAPDEDRFDHAHRSAEAAVRKLAQSG